MQRDRTELPRALACAFLFFLVIGSYYVVKSVREAVLVTWFSAHNQPGMYIIGGLVTFPIGLLMAAIARRWPRQVLLPVGYVACGVVFLAFWKSVPLLADASETIRTGIRAVYYFWVSAFILIATCLFWALTNDVFTKEQGKRWYGLIGAGGPIGGLVGSWVVKAYAKSLGAFGLVIITGVALFGCAAVAVVIHWMSPRKQEEEANAPRASARLCDLPRLLTSPYVALIAAIVVLHTFSETTVNLQSDAIQSTFRLGENAYAQFRGAYNTIMNSLALLVQLVIVTRVHARWGPKGGLLFLPVLTLALAPMLLWKAPARDVTLPWFGTIPYQLAVLALIGVPLQAFAYSIWQSSKELLYVPTDASVKYQAKSMIDTFGFRLGDTLSATLALTPPYGVARVGWFAALGYAGCVVWIWLAFRAGGAFQARRDPSSAATP